MSKKSKVTIKTGGAEYVVFVDTENLGMAAAYVESLLSRYVVSMKAEVTVAPEVSNDRT